MSSVNAPLPIAGIDHVVIMTTDVLHMLSFYKKTLGATSPFEQAFIDGKTQSLPILIGKAVVNLQAVEDPAYIVADQLVSGSTDLCFRWDAPIADAVTHLQSKGVEVIEGPVGRPAADGAWGKSVYFRDPEGNLLELLSTISDGG